MGIASLVLGIVSIVFALIPGLRVIGIIAGIVGTILGSMGKKNPDPANLASAGQTCSIIGTVLNGIFVIACVSCIGALGSLGRML